MLSLYQFLKIKSKVSPTITLKKDKDGINPILTKPSNFFCRRKKDLEGFLFWWGSYLFYTPKEVISVLSKSNSIINCGSVIYSSLCRQLTTKGAGKWFLHLTDSPINSYRKLGLIDALKRFEKFKRKKSIPALESCIA